MRVGIFPCCKSNRNFRKKIFKLFSTHFWKIHIASLFSNYFILLLCFSLYIIFIFDTIGSSDISHYEVTRGRFKEPNTKTILFQIVSCQQYETTIYRPDRTSLNFHGEKHETTSITIYFDISNTYENHNLNLKEHFIRKTSIFPAHKSIPFFDNKTVPYKASLTH